MLIKASYIITMTDENPLIENGGILVRNGLIEETGSFTDLKKAHPDEEVTDFTGKVILPGLINIHTHFYGHFARGISLTGESPVLFSQILNSLWWKLDKVLDRASIRLSAQVGLLDGIRSGVTTYFDHHASPGYISGSLEIIAEQIINTGVRGCLCYETSDRDGDKKALEGMQENARFAKAADSKPGKLAGMFGLHASMTLSDETLRKSRELEEKSDCGFHVHAAEGIEDVDNSLSLHGCRVVERFDRHGIITDNSILAHCIHLNENEIEILAEKKCLSAHNPESNLNNAVGIADIHRMMEKKVRIGAGTDGYTQGLWHTLRLMAVLPRYLHKKPGFGYCEPFSALMENSVFASKKFGIPLGIIRKKASADLIAIPYLAPTEFTAANIYGHLFFGIMENPVTDVMSNGKFIMKNRNILVLDEEKIMEESRKLSTSVWKAFHS